MTKQSKVDFASNGFGKRASPATTRDYHNREVVYAQGDPADAMFCIRHGIVKLTMTSSQNKEAAIAILSAGDCFGECCLFRNSIRTCTATSIQRSTIHRVSKRAMIRRLREEPLFARHLITHLLLRIGRVENDLADKLVNSSEKQLARLLLQLSGSCKRSGRPPAMLKVDQGTLAQAVGTTRARVSFFMNQFRKKGLIDYNGSVQVHKSLLTFLSS